MGLLDQLLLQLHEARRQYQHGEISKSDFINIRKEAHNKRLKINSQIKALKSNIKVALSQGKDGAEQAMQIFEQANLLDDFKIDPRDEYSQCERRGGIFVLPDDCMVFSQDESDSGKCTGCEHLETVKKLMEEPMPEKKKIDIEIADEKLINDAVQFINKKAHETTEKANETVYKGSIEIGKYILMHFFDGDLKRASSKNPRKQKSFNKLCQHEGLIVNPNRLGLMVRVASQEQYFVDKKIDTKELSYTHKASLVKIDNGIKKADIIEKCIKEEWTTRKLEDEIKKYLKTLPSSSKPSPIRTTKKYIAKMDVVLETVEDTELDFNTDDISKMSKQRRDDLKKYLEDLDTRAKAGVDRSKAITKRCGAALKKLAQIESEKKKNPVKRGRPAKKK